MTDSERVDVDVKKIEAAFPPPWSHPSYRNPHYLTDSELKVLEMVAYGKTNQEIASARFVSVLTVREQVKQLHAKCDIAGRPRLAVAAYKFFEMKQT